MKKRKYEIGEYISLNWGDYDAPEYYVRGHVTPYEFIKSKSAYTGCVYKLPIVEHKWARWEMDGSDEYGNPQRRLVVYEENDKKGGKFAVTVAEAKQFISLSDWHIGDYVEILKLSSGKSLDGIFRIDGYIPADLLDNYYEFTWILKSAQSEEYIAWWCNSEAYKMKDPDWDKVKAYIDRSFKDAEQSC